MADTERHPLPNEFHSRLTSPKDAEQVGTEMHNGGILAFKVYPKAWEDDHHHSSTERFDFPSPQIDDDDDIEDHMNKCDQLQRSVNLPPMSPTMLSPPPKYVPSQDFSQSMPALNGDAPFKDDKNYSYVCSYQKAIDENPLSPTTEIRRTQCERVIDEIITTEHLYVKDLSQIITGYQEPMLKKVDVLGISDDDLIALFNNIEEIKDFNEFQLKRLQQCKDNVKLIAQCFIDIWEKAEGSNIYSDYCTKYPRAVAVWGKFAKDVKVMNFLKKCQQRLGHMLPLAAYLLKPVQRVLKYYLLLEKIDACLTTGEDGKEEIKAAVVTMTEVGDRINEVKKKYEDTVKIQEIQAQLDGWEGNDLTTYGDLVCQDTFRFLGGKPANATIRLTTERHLFLFQRLLLMTKKKEEHFVCKQHINISDMQVQGVIPKYPSCFQIRQISTTRVFTFQARTQALKEEWVKIFNKILVDSVADTVDMDMPNKEKLLWFAGLTTDDNKKKRHATMLDVSGSKKPVQKSNSFRRQSTPYDYHKNKPIHRAESPDEAQFRNRAHTTANTSRSLHRRGIGYSQLPDAKRDQLDVNSQRSKSVHTGPTADDDSGDDHKPKLSRRSSDTTSPTLLSDDEEDEVVKVVKRELQVKHNRKNAIKRRSTSSISSLPPMSPTSVSSEDPTTTATATTGLQESLPPPELSELRSMSQHSNYTSVSSAGSCEDIHMIQSPEHLAPLPNGSHDPVISEFPSVGPPAGQNLQLDTSMVLSASDNHLDTNHPTSVRSPTIFIDVFDTDANEQNRASPTAELCTADNPLGDDILLDASTNKVVSKLDTTAGGDENLMLGATDIDMLSQEILNEISTVGMSLNEDQFKLPDEYEYSPVTKRKDYSDLSALDQVIFPRKHDQQKQHTSPDSSPHISCDIFPSALPSNDMESSRFSMENMRSSSNASSSSASSRHRYQDSHHMTLASKVAAGDNPSQYYVHISPYASDNESPKSSKRNYTNGITSHPLHNSRESPKSQRQKHYSSPASAMEHQWREISPQLADDPNEEFVLPPPPQFQCEDTTEYQSSTTPYHQSSMMDVSNVEQRASKPRLTNSSSSSNIQDSSEKSSPSTSKQPRTLKGGRSNFSASHLMEMGNMDEEILLTDMLKSLDQMAEKKYHEEMQQRNSLKDRQPYTSESKAEKSDRRKQKKKAIKRRTTIGIYDFNDLIKQSIRENHPVRAEEYPRQTPDTLKVTDDSKVKKLAREYSNKAKDKQSFNIRKRFSVHSYENFSGSEPTTPEAKPKDPSWKMTADAKREAHRRQPPSPAAKRLPTIVSGSAGIGVAAARGSTGVADCTIVSNEYVTHPSSSKFTKHKSSPVMMRSSSPVVRSRIEGFEKLSQSKDDFPVVRKSESVNPARFPTRGKTFSSGTSHVKSQENIAAISSNQKSTGTSDKQERGRHQTSSSKGSPLGAHSRELSKSHGSLHPMNTTANVSNAKSYRGLSVFSPDSLDESDIIYKPSTPTGFHKDEFEHIRTRGGFKGWVKNLVDKFSK